MGSSRLIPLTLDTMPVALVAVLAAWAFWDFLGIPATTLSRALIALLLLGFAALVLGVRFSVRAVRRAGLGAVAVSYLGAHVTLLPLDPAPALAFLTLVLVALEARILAERFAPIYRLDLDDEARLHVNEALTRSVTRLAGAAAVGFLGATLTADLGLSGALPLRTILSAIFLSMGLVAVILLLAFWPLLEQSGGQSVATETGIQTPK